MKSNRLSWAYILLSAVLGAACGRTGAEPTSYPASTSVKMEVPTYVVERGLVSRNLEAGGRIAPVEELPLYFETSGYVTRVLVQPGELVDAGDLLAELDILETGGQQNQILLAELDLESAQVALAEAIAAAERAVTLARQELALTISLQGTYAGPVAAAQVGLEQAEDEVARAQIEYQEALDRPWETQDVVDSYAFALRQARWDLEIAQAEYNQAVADQSSYQHQLSIARTTVEQAEAELKRLQSGQDAVPAIELERAERALEWLEGGSRLIAPVGGRVISISLFPGQLVEPYSPVIIVADTSELEVSASLGEDELREVSEGQRAVITSGVDPTHSWEGSIRSLPYPYGTGGGAEPLAGGAYPIRIKLESGTDEARLGELVRVAIPLEEKSDALWLPADAIRRFQGQAFVIVQTGAGQRRADIQVGIEGNDQVEILSGLEEGQRVVAP